MSIKLALALAGFAGLVGLGFGYFLRWIVALGKKGSMELQIKQMMLDAREAAKKILQEAEGKAETLVRESSAEIKSKESDVKKAEERIIKKEEFLDKRQVDIDKEVENIKVKVIEIKEIRERNHVSQPVFARYLNTSKSTVQKWEIGAKRPSGMALKLLSVVQKHGLHILD